MKKTIFLALLACAVQQQVLAQTLFSFGNQQVSKQAFLKAFNKNPVQGVNRKQALNEYLQLYIHYKLKVKAAYDENLHNEPTIQLESTNFRNQLADNYINEEANIKLLIDEAVARSKKDIHVAQLLIEVAPGKDTLQAFQQIQKAYAQLKKGQKFGQVVAQFATDSAAKHTQGSIGFISAFTLAYPFENEIYKLKPGQFSAPFKSKLGYHIFLNKEERKAFGKRKIAQLFVATPPNATPQQRMQAQKIADSAYQLYQKGISFEKLVQDFSDDHKTAFEGGVLPLVSVGDFDPDYEKQIYQLPRVGSVSKPFATSVGYHMIKLLEIQQPTFDSTDAAAFADIKQRIEKDERLAIAKKQLLQKWLKQTHYQSFSAYQLADLWQLTDSILANKEIAHLRSVNDSTPLFAFGIQKVYVADWIKYVRSVRFNTNRSNYHQVFNDFINNTCIDYYRNHLHEYNAQLTAQLQEFDEANLLFSAMDKHVWSKATEDTAGLRNYYLAHAQKYLWQPGISALVVTCANASLATELAGKLANNIANWQLVVSQYGTLVNTDSARFENQQLPVKAVLKSEVGYISQPEKSANDESYVFVVVTAIHTNNTIRSFEEARGLVINDYQQLLEEKWLAQLKATYPVTINNAVLATIE